MNIVNSLLNLFGPLLHMKCFYMRFSEIIINMLSLVMFKIT